MSYYFSICHTENKYLFYFPGLNSQYLLVKAPDGEGILGF